MFEKFIWDISRFQSGREGPRVRMKFAKKKKNMYILDLFFFSRNIIASRGYVIIISRGGTIELMVTINPLTSRASLSQKQPPFTARELTAYPRTAESTGPACSIQRSLSYLLLLLVHGRIMDLSRGAKASHIDAAHNRPVRLTLIGLSDLGGCFRLRCLRCLRNLLGAYKT